MMDAMMKMDAMKMDAMMDLFVCPRGWHLSSPSCSGLLHRAKPGSRVRRRELILDQKSEKVCCLGTTVSQSVSYFTVPPRGTTEPRITKPHIRVQNK